MSYSENKSSVRSELRSSEFKIEFEKLEDRQLLAADLTPRVPYASAQLWQSIDESDVNGFDDALHVRASDIQFFDVNETLLLRTLANAPLEFTELDGRSTLLTLPTPSGEFQRYEVLEAKMMDAELAAKFPGIKTYRGLGVDDPSASVSLDVTAHGFHAQVFDAQGTWYVDPYFHLESEYYAIYKSSDAFAQPGNSDYREIGVVGANGQLLSEYDQRHQQEINHESGYQTSSHSPDCVADGDSQTKHEPGCQCAQCLGETTTSQRSQANDETVRYGNQSSRSQSGISESRSSGFVSGLELRTFDTAVAATGEYTQFHGGSVASGLSAIVTAMNRVNQIYERDIAARMILVADNDQIIYVNGNTDPYTNNSGSSMLGENQSNLDAVIGDANYDLGHVFSTGGGGIAGLGVIGISGQKARGVTGLGSPIGDPFYIDYVAHEIGHQYGGRHTFNGDSGSCSGNRSGSAAYEPGSGSTIQAYAGICGNDNLQSNSDDMFHSESISEMRETITTGAGNAAATLVTTNNSQPVVDAGMNYTIPAETPFTLTAEGSDPDSNDVLTYSWEQRDLGPQQDVNGGDNGSSPLFRAWLPTEDPSRTFPRLSDLLNNTTVVGETLPTTDRTMDFRVVLRDNSLEPAGGIATDDMTVTVVDTGAAFEITSQNTATTWIGGNTETISWNVAGSDAAPINAEFVDLLFSADGGGDFDIVLASNVSNDGEQSISVPNIATGNGRIMVRAANNIFFDVNNSAIEVVEGGPGIQINQSAGSTRVGEAGLEDSYTLSFNTVPVADVEVRINSDSQTEISSDGTTFGSSLTIIKSDDSASTIFVRAIDDSSTEADHISRITHRIISSSDPDYNSALIIPNVVVDVADNEVAAGQLLVGVDFGPDGDVSPTNWTQVAGSNSTLTLTNLIYEDGTASPYGMVIEELVDGQWNTDDPTVNANTLPQYSNDLSNIDGQIWTNSDPLQVTWTGLNQASTYEVYVFGLEGFYDDIEQQVTISGGNDPITFSQGFLQNDVFINDTLGSSASNLADYAIVVTPNNSGEIVINVNPLPGGNDVVLGAVAISEISPISGLTPLGSKFLDGSISDGSLFDTFDSDDVYLDAIPSPTSNPVKQIVDLILVSEYSGRTPSSFEFVLETKFAGGPQGDVLQTVRLWDFQTRQWELVDVRSAMLLDSRLQVPLSGDLTRFVNQFNGEVRARIGIASPQFFGPAFSWDLAIDQFNWLISEDSA